MLYKKYHRNFVSQFKKGAWFKYSYYKREKVAYEVENEPYYDGAFWRRNIRMTGSKYDLVLVFPSGQLAEVEVIKRNAV